MLPISVATPADTEVAVKYKAAKLSAKVIYQYQVKLWPVCQKTSISPSGLLLSVIGTPHGFFKENPHNQGSGRSFKLECKAK